MGLGGLVLGSPIPYLKGIRILMFQLSGFYYKSEDDCKALVLFISISKEKSNTNAQYNWVFKLDKRTSSLQRMLGWNVIWASA